MSHLGTEGPQSESLELGGREWTLHIPDQDDDPFLPYPVAALGPGKFQTGCSAASGEAAEQPCSCWGGLEVPGERSGKSRELGPPR